MSNGSVPIRMKESQKERTNRQDSQAEIHEFNLLQKSLNERFLQIKNEDNTGINKYNNDDQLDELSKELLKRFKRIVVTSNEQT